MFTFNIHDLIQNSVQFIVGSPLDVHCKMWFMKKNQLKSNAVDNKDRPQSQASGHWSLGITSA